MRFGRLFGLFVMYLLDLVEFLLHNTQETKLQALTKKYNVTI